HYCFFSYSTILIPTFHLFYFIFPFTYPTPTEIYTLSLHDALPIYEILMEVPPVKNGFTNWRSGDIIRKPQTSSASGSMVTISFLDRKSIRLNSSHVKISYAVFCLKKKKKIMRANKR